jgi:hypothetical protein
MTLSAIEIEELRVARALLEHPGLAVKITNLLGTPIEKGLALLPAGASKKIQRATTWALTKALRVAMTTMGKKSRRKPADFAHKALAIGAGGAGGFFGIVALPIELPVSTAIMLRSIADHARSQGEDLASVEARLACMEVFALGGPSRRDDAAETGYFAVRAALAAAVAEAAQFIAEKGLVEEGAPVIARLLAQIASRFSVSVSEKVAAEAVPVIGALGGATVNAIFIGHFQDMARGHFTVRRLERTHGLDAVRRAYEALGEPPALLRDPPRLA